MTTKTTGAEWKRFYLDEAVWVGDAYHDDEEITVDGVEPGDIDLGQDIPDAAVVTVHGGGFYWSGNRGEAPSLETVFKRWRKAQTTVTFTVDCPKDKEVAVREAIKAAGGKASK